jgi:uncharacterized protein DUF1360
MSTRDLKVADSPAPGLPAPENLGAIEEPGPAEYGALNALYLTALAGVLAATRNRDGDARELIGTELIPLTAATFAVAKMISREKIGTWVREPFVDDPAGRKRPRGGSVRRALGELVTCSRCIGAWTALGFVGLRLAHPRTGRTVTAVFATAGFNDFAQAAFRGLCDWTNSQRR